MTGAYLPQRAHVGEAWRIAEHRTESSYGARKATRAQKTSPRTR
jgi:hypothetical protein